MKKTFNLKLFSPEKPLADVWVEQLGVPGVAGEMGILPGHTALIAALKPGVLSVWEAGKQQPLYYYIGSGYIRFLEDQAFVLSDTINIPDEIDRERVEAAERRAKERLAQTTDSAIDISRALKALERAKARRKLMDISL